MGSRSAARDLTGGLGNSYDTYSHEAKRKTAKPLGAPAAGRPMADAQWLSEQAYSTQLRSRHLATRRLDRMACLDVDDEQNMRCIRCNTCVESRQQRPGGGLHRRDRRWCLAARRSQTRFTPVMVDEAAACLLRFRNIVDSRSMGEAPNLPVVTGIGHAYRRPDGVTVAP